VLKLTTDKHEASRGLSVTAELLVFSPWGSHTILIFPYKTSWQYSDGDHLTGKKSRFSTNVWLMSDFSFLCTFVPGSEKSTDGTFVPWNIRSLELSLLWNFRSSGANVPRTFAPWNFRSCGTFLPSERIGYSKNFRFKRQKTI